MCPSCPHKPYVQTGKRLLILVNGKESETHPCHENVKATCHGSEIQSGSLSEDTLRITLTGRSDAAFPG